MRSLSIHERGDAKGNTQRINALLRDFPVMRDYFAKHGKTFRPRDKDQIREIFADFANFLDA